MKLAHHNSLQIISVNLLRERIEEPLFYPVQLFYTREMAYFTRDEQKSMNDT